MSSVILLDRQLAGNPTNPTRAFLCSPTSPTKRYNVTSLKNDINRVPIVFNYAYDNRLIRERVAFAQDFACPPG